MPTTNRSTPIAQLRAMTDDELSDHERATRAEIHQVASGPYLENYAGAVAHLNRTIKAIAKVRAERNPTPATGRGRGRRAGR